MTSFTLSAPVVSVSFQRSSDARYLACATAHAVSLFSRVSNRLVARFAVSSPARAASFSAGRDSRPPTGAAAKITAVAFSPAHLNLLVAADESGCVNVWDVAKNVAPRARTEPKLNGVPEQDNTYARFTSPFRAPAAGISFAPPGGNVGLCVGGFDKQLRFFDPVLKKLLFSVGCAAPVSAVSFSSDAEHVAVGLTNGKMQVLRIDAESGSGKVVTEVVVDEGQGGEPTAVRSVHFQPMDGGNDKAEKGLRKGLQDALSASSADRPFRLAGIAERASPMKRLGTAARESNSSSDESDLLLTGLADEDEDEEYVDSLGDGLDVVTDAKRQFPTGMLRSAAGPRDSDIFSPVAPRTPRHAADGAVKASSFHETPRTAERRANITFRTPRSRSVQALTSAAEKDGTEERAERVFGNDDLLHVLDADPGSRLAGELGETDQVDSDSLDSISGKSPPKTGPDYPTQGDVSQLQGSTLSDDVGHAFSDERGENASRGSDRGTVSSPLSRSGNEMSPQHKTESGQASRFPRSSSQGVSGTSTNGGQMLRRHSSVPEKMTRPLASVSFESPGKKRDVNASVQPSSSAGMQNLGASSSTGDVEKMPSQDRLLASVSGAASRAGALPAAEKADWMAGFGEQLRQVITQELDVVKAELRSDILNIHSEMVVISARQSQELKAAFVERDRRVKQLETEVRRLQGDNERLRRKYGLP